MRGDSGNTERSINATGRQLLLGSTVVFATCSIFCATPAASLSVGLTLQYGVLPLLAFDLALFFLTWCLVKKFGKDNPIFLNSCFASGYKGRGKGYYWFWMIGFALLQGLFFAPYFSLLFNAVPNAIVVIGLSLVLTAVLSLIIGGCVKLFPPASETFLKAVPIVTFFVILLLTVLPLSPEVNCMLQAIVFLLGISIGLFAIFYCTRTGDRYRAAPGQESSDNIEWVYGTARAVILLISLLNMLIEFIQLIASFQMQSSPLWVINLIMCGPVFGAAAAAAAVVVFAMLLQSPDPAHSADLSPETTLELGSESSPPYWVAIQLVMTMWSHFFRSTGAQNQQAGVQSTELGGGSNLEILPQRDPTGSSASPWDLSGQQQSSQSDSEGSLAARYHAMSMG